MTSLLVLYFHDPIAWVSTWLEHYLAIYRPNSGTNVYSTLYAHTHTLELELERGPPSKVMFLCIHADLAEMVITRAHSGPVITCPLGRVVTHLCLVKSRFLRKVCWQVTHFMGIFVSDWATVFLALLCSSFSNLFSIASSSPDADFPLQLSLSCAVTYHIFSSTYVKTSQTLSHSVPPTQLRSMSRSSLRQPT